MVVLIVYDTREIKGVKREYKLQFLIFHRDEWSWIYAKDWVPA